MSSWGVQSSCRELVCSKIWEGTGHFSGRTPLSLSLKFLPFTWYSLLKVFLFVLVLVFVSADEFLFLFLFSDLGVERFFSGFASL